MPQQYNPPVSFGPMILFGSGETSPSGQKIFNQLFQQLPKNAQVSLLETPAGFELNSHAVTVRIAEFLRHHLQNYRPQINIIPARERGTPFSPDDAKIAAPLLEIRFDYRRAGQPQLRCPTVAKQHYLALSVGTTSPGCRLSIFQRRGDRAQRSGSPGLRNLQSWRRSTLETRFGFLCSLWPIFGLIPHWNNNDGGDELDTNRCFVGRARFDRLLEMLLPEQVVMGIDEHTALWLDCAGQCCTVFGVGTVTVLHHQKKRVFSSGDTFPLSDLMDCRIPDPTEGIPADIWAAAQNAAQTGFESAPVPPRTVQNLAEQRQSARDQSDWAAADELRDQIVSLGWNIKDTPEGPVLHKQ